MPRKLAIVMLVLLILLLVIPLGIGMAMGVCPDCTTPGMPAGLAMCAALIAGLIVAACIFSRRFNLLTTGPPVLAFARSLERPPRTV
ncbi:MAG: hypothetical protein M3P11_12760 [Actinomycetota bacterium]|nr:hypothetical protein [Actinomycetota bacterium]